ncbi:MAG: dTMP kinase [Gammaproteobacteria bacterium]|nr:dTMP kinase [Gammaproteobacteria bacterium]MBA3730994.1 dTMP kinase [Gammaproteobacteria bacterium]
MKAPRFITVEGIEGVGKSTHISTLCELLRVHGIDVVATREPGGTELGDRLRGLLLANGMPAMGPDTELLLIFAARAQHLSEVVWPALATGRWVVSDRFTDATYAYQGAGRGIADQRIADLEQWVQNDFRPDHTLLLQAGIETARSRIRSRGPADRFEREDADFFVRVQQAYLERATREPRRFHVIDANGGLDDVRRRIAGVIETLFT